MKQPFIASFFQRNNKQPQKLAGTVHLDACCLNSEGLVCLVRCTGGAPFKTGCGFGNTLAVPRISTSKGARPTNIMIGY